MAPITTSSTAPAAPTPLDQLQSSVNTVLVNIGRTFRDSNRPDSKLMVKSSPQQRSQNISTANGQLHEALDSIEVDLLRARTILERDLNQLRNAREERERAFNATQNVAAAGPSAADAVPTPVSMNKESSQPDLSIPETLTMNDIMNSNPMPGFHALSPSKPSEKAAAANAPVNGLPTSAAPSVLAHSMAVPSATGLGGSQPAPAADTDINFDDLFAVDNHNDTFDLDFVTTADTTDPFGDSDFNLTNLNNGGDGTGEDIDSIMPGLESYVNADGDGGAGGDFMTGLTGGDGFDMGLDTVNTANAITTANADSNSNANANAGANGTNANGEAKTATRTNSVQETNGLGISGGDVEMAGVDAAMEGPDGGSMDDLFGDMDMLGQMDSAGASMDNFDEWFNP